MKFHLDLAKNLWRSLLKPGDLALDATVGNGHDTLFLWELGCEVIGLDIQKEALEQTKKLLGERNVLLLQRSHAEIGYLVLPRPAKLIVYNLGYLPGGDKQITTLQDSTLQSVEQALKLLEEEGALSITCYPGHEEGLREEISLLKWASCLDSKQWHVSHYRCLNREKSPSLLWISGLRPSNRNCRKSQ